MNILHIAHFDMDLTTEHSFVHHITNGLERFLTSFITALEMNQFILLFDEKEHRVLLTEITSDGEFSLYCSYDNVVLGSPEFNELIQMIAEKLQISLVHIHYLKSFILAIPRLFKETDVKTLVTMHDENLLAKDFGQNKEYEKREEVATFFHDVDKIVFPHEVIYQHTLSLYPFIYSKSEIINNGVDVEKIASVNEASNFKALFLGGFNKYKGSEIIEQLLLEKNDGVEYHLLGTIDKEELPFASVDTYTPESLIEKIKRINPDIVINPSIVQESFSYTAAEATGMGYPLLVFPVGALTLVEDEGRGFVAESISSEGLSKKLAEIRFIKQNSIERWEKFYTEIAEKEIFSTEEMLKLYMDLYSKMIVRESMEPNRQFFLEKMCYDYRKNTHSLLLLRKQTTLQDEAYLELHREFNDYIEQNKYNKRHPIKYLWRKIKEKVGVK